MGEIKGSVAEAVENTPCVCVKFIPLKGIFAFTVAATALHVFAFDGNFTLIIALFGWAALFLSCFLNKLGRVVEGEISKASPHEIEKLKAKSEDEMVCALLQKGIETSTTYQVGKRMPEPEEGAWSSFSGGMRCGLPGSLADDD